MEPIKHHYIPQFILRNFCFKDKLLYYYNKNTNTTSIKRTDEIFMLRNLYRDEINYTDNPTQIEVELSKFENEVVRIINNKILSTNEITLSKDDENRLRLFIAVMAFRNKRAFKWFGSNMINSNKEYFKCFQNDENFIDLWKRNLGYIVDCRSLQEVAKHDKIDLPFKYYMIRDGFIDYEGVDSDLLKLLINSPGDMLQFMKYFVVIERRGEKDFVIGDNYPPQVLGELDNGKSLHLYTICPTSPSRSILLVSMGIFNSPSHLRVFEDKILKLPSYDNRGNLVITVKKVYQNVLEELNNSIISQSVEGYAFVNKERVGNVYKYNKKM